jgi:hypothetical protein
MMRGVAGGDLLQVCLERNKEEKISKEHALGDPVAPSGEMIADFNNEIIQFPVTMYKTAKGKYEVSF